MMTCGEAKVASAAARIRIEEEERLDARKELEVAEVAVVDYVRDKIKLLENATLMSVKKGSFGIEMDVDRPHEMSDLEWKVATGKVINHFSELGYNGGYSSSDDASHSGTFSVRWT